MGEAVDELFDEVGRVGVKTFALRSGIAILLYAIPAAALSLLLMRLTEGALWVPSEWRSVILLLGFLGGSACFALARNQVHNRFRAVAPVNAPGATPSVRQARLDESKDRHFARRRFALSRALIWLVPTLALIGAFALLKARYVQTWNPSLTTVYNTLRLNSPDNPMLAGLEQRILRERDYVEGAAPRYTLTEAGAPAQGADRAVAANVSTPELAPLEDGWEFEFHSSYLTYEDDKFEGSILLPVGFPNSAVVDNQLEELYVAKGSPPDQSRLQIALEHSPLQLIETIDTAEHDPLGRTRFYFVLVHIGLLLAASTAYGYSYSRAEDVVSTWLGPED